MEKYKLTRDVKFLPLEMKDPQLAEDLRKLADYLYALPDDYEHFDMSYLWFDRNTSNSDIPTINGSCEIITKKHVCGTVACVAGHAPAAGIDCSRFEYYGELVEYLTNENQSNAYYWLVASEWFHVDNTVKGAAARIYIALDHGIPTDYVAQLNERKKLCYSVV